MQSRYKLAGLAVLCAIVLLGIMGTPVAADDPDIDLCGDDGEDVADTVQNVFLILAALGPIFGTLFFVGLSVAASASTGDNQYQKKRRKVLISGFSVPIAIAFLGTIADEITGDDVEVHCFFPNLG